MKDVKYFFDIWPGRLDSIVLRGGMNETELWMLKERMDAGAIKMLKGPEQAFGGGGVYHSIMGDEGGTYVIQTQGNPVGNDTIDSAWCYISLVNKLTPEQASRFMSNWPYE